jgi:hypothetical protein
MKPAHRVRIIVLMAISVVGILLVSFYSGRFSLFVQAFGANAFFGFGMYFLVQLFKIPDIERTTTNAVYALVFTGAQEMAQFVGVSPGVFDPWDFVANGFGILLAMGVNYFFHAKPLFQKKA